VTAVHVRPILALCALASCAPPIAAQHWRMQYLYDEAKGLCINKRFSYPLGDMV